MFGFLKLCAIFMVIAFPVFIWIGIEQGNTPPGKIISQPKSADEFLRRGTLYEKNGNYEEALNDYTKAIALRPNDGRGYIRQGLALEGLSRPEEAFQKYQKAKEIAQIQGNRNEIQHADFLIQQLTQRK